MPGNGATAAPLDFVVLHEGAEPPVKIVPAHRWRDWMSATSNRFANRCLPLLMANQAGWVLLNTLPFEARWDGGVNRGDLTVEYDGDVPKEDRIARSHFGYGILTFNFGCAFRTPAGYNVLAKGPANEPKDGIGPLEGLIETDWTTVPFTMNWKLTRPGTVRFESDEPFCQVLPQRRGELERFRTGLQSVDGNESLTKSIRAWAAARLLVMAGMRSNRDAGETNWPRLWLPDYFKGEAPGGERSEEHQTQLRLDSFDSQLSPGRAPEQG